jgi:hypothetical protein
MDPKTAKDELYDTALNEFGVKLDRRQKMADLEEQVNKLKINKADSSPVSKELKNVPKTVRNIVTGNEFPYTSAFKGLSDLEVIEWETEDGDN